MSVVPYKEEKKPKKIQVTQMFDNISAKYDFLNHLLSLGTDLYWRKRAIALLKNKKAKNILDVATGTADLALEALSLQPDKIVGIDISEGMLAEGRKKIAKYGFENTIELRTGDCENLSFETASFDAVIVAYGVRNFQNLEKGLEQIYRVLKKNGTLVVLEFSKPTTFPFKQLYNCYFRYILPLIGRVISKDRSAYTYLPESVQAFPDGKHFNDQLINIGFHSVTCIPLTFGISSIYTGEK